MKMKEYITCIIIIITSVSFVRVKGDWLRCFCTESTCVQTNYMCRTYHGSCYSRLTFDPTSNKILSTRYGCDDGGILSHSEKPDTCRSKVKSESESGNSTSHHLQSRSIIPDEEEDWELSWKGRRRHNNNNTRMAKSTTRIFRLTTETETRAVSRDVENLKEDSVDSDMTGNTQINNNNNIHLDRISVVCCDDDDMCNYNRDDTFERTINRDLSSSTNTDLQRTNSQQYKEHFIASLSPRHANSDLWFKMAVCLVTVVGAAILVVIVISAMRMLRSEKRYFRRQQFYCDCPHHVIDAVLVAGDVSSKQQLLFPVADGRYCRSYYKSPLASPSSVEQHGIV